MGAAGQLIPSYSAPGLSCAAAAADAAAGYTQMIGLSSLDIILSLEAGASDR